MTTFRCPEHPDETRSFDIPDDEDAGREFFFSCGRRVTGADVSRCRCEHDEHDHDPQPLLGLGWQGRICRVTWCGCTHFTLEEGQ